MLQKSCWSSSDGRDLLRLTHSPTEARVCRVCKSMPSIPQLPIDPQLFRCTETPQSIKGGRRQQRALSTRDGPIAAIRGDDERGGTKRGTEALQKQQPPPPRPPNTATTPRALPSLSFSLSFSPHLSTLQKMVVLFPVKLQNLLRFLSLADEHAAHVKSQEKSSFESVRVFMNTRIDLKLSFDL